MNAQQNSSLRKAYLILHALVFCSPVAFAHDPHTFAPASTDTNGFLIHEVKSPYQSGTARIRVLMPTDAGPGNRYPVIYVLPVEPLGENRFGDGLLEIKKHHLQSKHRAIFVAPDFSQLPWYADHPTDSKIRQESYLLDCVIPFVDRTYPVQGGAAGRLLLGFSKSGWGAWSLLLRNPDKFSKAVAWDAPLMMNQVGEYGSTSVFGTQENFEKYQITRLVRASDLGESKRLILTGFGGFRQDHQQMHSLLDELKVSHEFRDETERKHDWHSGWVPEAVGLLMAK